MSMAGTFGSVALILLLLAPCAWILTGRLIPVVDLGPKLAALCLCGFGVFGLVAAIGFVLQ
ncbi:hypothetical protein ACIOGT_24620 [Streptomyces microflavus]|uniref:hypothetical protein n=1 Tax=Streptomyces microflavus TaxID=1919 RepID=UPI0037FC7C59